MDPTKPLPPEHGRDSSAPSDRKVSLDGILEKNLEVADIILKKLGSESTDFTPREFKDLVSAAGSIASLAHRTENLQRQLRTYQLFTETVMDFLRNRSDALGEDLVSELQRVSFSLKAGSEVGQVVAGQTPS